MLTGNSQFYGVFSVPPSLAPTFFQLDIMGALHTGFVHVILVLVLVEVFDATGTMIGVATRANLIQEGKPNRLGRALLADSSAIVAGRSEEHTSELQSLMRTSYAVFCLKKKQHMNRIQ